MRTIIFLFLISFGLFAKSQVNKCGFPCGGMSIVEAGIHIKGYPVLVSHGFRYSEISIASLQKGFTVVSDSSYKVTWFLLSHSTENGIKEYSINGSSVNSLNGEFLKKLKPGDSFNLECIHVRKDGSLSLSTTFIIFVTK